MNTLDTLASRYVKKYCKRNGLVYKELNKVEQRELWIRAKDSIEPLLLEFYVAQDAGDKPTMIKKWSAIMQSIVRETA